MWLVGWRLELDRKIRSSSLLFLIVIIADTTAVGSNYSACCNVCEPNYYASKFVFGAFYCIRGENNILYNMITMIILISMVCIL